MLPSKIPDRPTTTHRQWWSWCHDHFWNSLWWISFTDAAKSQSRTVGNKWLQVYTFCARFTRVQCTGIFKV